MLGYWRVSPREVKAAYFGCCLDFSFKDLPISSPQGTLGDWSPPYPGLSRGNVKVVGLSVPKDYICILLNYRTFCTGCRLNVMGPTGVVVLFSPLCHLPSDADLPAFPVMLFLP